MQKKCNTCHASKPVSEFPWRNKSRGIRRGECSSCRNAMSRDIYWRHKRGEPVAKIAASPIVGSLSTTYKTCKRCGKSKPLTQFHRSHQGTRLACWDTYCKPCAAIRQRELKKAGYVRPSASLLESRIMESQHKRSTVGGVKTPWGRIIPCDLVISDIREIIKRQTVNGALRCPRTGLVFVEERLHPFTPSLDRIDSALGYTRDNCRLTTAMYNFARGNLTDKRFWSALQDEPRLLTEKDLKTLSWQILPHSSRNKQYTISSSDVLALLMSKCEGGLLRCATGITSLVAQKGHPLRPSIDRIDNSLGYIPGNIQIVSRAFNCGRGRSPLPLAIDCWRQLVSAIRSPAD